MPRERSVGEQLTSLSHNGDRRKSPGLSFSGLQFSERLERPIKILPVLTKLADTVVTVPPFFYTIHHSVLSRKAVGLFVLR